MDGSPVRCIGLFSGLGAGEYLWLDPCTKMSVVRQTEETRATGQQERRWSPMGISSGVGATGVAYAACVYVHGG